MTPKEIAALIRTCKNAGISTFKLDNLSFTFKEKTEPQATLTPSGDDALVELERKLAEDDDLRALRIQNLMLEEPLRYEEVMRSPDAANY
jgi:hypothetical protein